VHLTGRIGIEGDQVPLEDQRTHPAERLAGPVPVDAVGYGPKTLQRVLRFRRFVTRRPPAQPSVAGASREHTVIGEDVA
jgi:hypothetical protein